MIEGDNLEVLKLLQKSYAGKVKLIYIDPPYNTGKDFVYPDNYRDNIQNYLELTGQVDGENRKLSSNTEVSGTLPHRLAEHDVSTAKAGARALLKREDGAIGRFPSTKREYAHLSEWQCDSDLFGRGELQMRHGGLGNGPQLNNSILITCGSRDTSFVTCTRSWARSKNAIEF